MIDNESWQTSIENSAAFVAAHLGNDTVKHIYQKYNANCVEDLMPCDYSDVFNELYTIEADLRN